ncbi:Delta(12)-acyl-lipid-desaturase [Pseudolycoriella hygida]|uniref:Delta(12)-acyl-lipid-desaturase n=1 Tax=Pseudolycoriella hygida TaxID=35572 RepID=A0A9Q0N238_9DIPT|nr:Delta(12)-acyl-lipid-desaturase [Pseudolycoriella hygida]
MCPGPDSNLKMEDRQELSKAGYTHVTGTPKPQPIPKPQFTLSELKAAVPAHCFERNMVKSFGYLAWDLLVCSVLFYGVYVVLELMSLPLIFKVPAYLVYWFVQGSYMAGIWVIAHECGHQAFSSNHIVNDIVGLILHSALFVPYHSWKITHRRHHSNTGSCENDEVFVPYSQSSVKPTWSETLEDSPLYNLYRIVAMLLVGWMPAYLCFNAYGPMKYRNSESKSHFNPYAQFFLPKERMSIILSDVAFAAAALTLGYFIYTYGFALVFKLYLAPYLVTNAHLVLITFLQHTDTYIPHFREGEWTWLRGSLCTVDRTFGTWLDGVLHHIVDTHVCHHIFSKMPHYNATEATEALRPILGQYYLKDTTPVFSALWRAFTHCKFVPDDGKVVFYQKNMKDM